ncbi:hypothetical protein [Ekhidna sp.]|uniref:hypothetical protein n=1 Tax=Ekhidna sp. TaxID=2608089 RepID=UPI0032967E3B
MRNTISTLLTVLSVTAFCQINYDFDLNKIEFKGLEFNSTRVEIEEICGVAKIVYPDYECGFHSPEQSGGPYYQLVYLGYNFIGSDKEEFQIEKIGFDPDGNSFIKYEGTRIDGTTTIDSLSELLGSSIATFFKTNPDKRSILLYSNNSDDGAVFTFNGIGNLSRFEYYSPC